LYLVRSFREVNIKDRARW